MEGYRIPAGEGRSRGVLVQPGDEGDFVRLGIISTYGNVLESVDLDADTFGAVVAALGWAREDADRNLLDRLTAEQGASERRLRAAYARNPYLNGAYERSRAARRRRRERAR